MRKSRLSRSKRRSSWRIFWLAPRRAWRAQLNSWSITLVTSPYPSPEPMRS